MSAVVFSRHSALVQLSRPCRRRLFAQSAFAQQETEELSEPRETEAESSASPKTRSRKLKAKEPMPAPAKPPRLSKVDLYLASIQSAGLEPSLEDLERCRPARHAIPGSSKYTKEYNELVENLSRSFSSEQLRQLGILYGLDPIWTRPKRLKVEYAQAIIEKKWMWPNLKEIERKNRDKTEVLTQSFSVSPSQLFLILGKDGADLLQLSKEFGVHVSLVQQPLSLKIEGLRGSLKLISERILDLKKSTIDEIFQLSSSGPLPQSYIQRISRLSGAFIENIGFHGKVRICALNSHNLSIAKRLASRIIHHIEEPKKVPILSHIPPAAPITTPVPTSLFRHEYSLYPFLSHRALPWEMSTGGVFRVRRVGEWLGQEPCENIRKTGGLEKGAGKILTLAQEPADLKGTLLGGLSKVSLDTTRTVTASTGHILFSNPGLGQRATLVPPLKGHWPFAKILKWAETIEAPSAFVPSIPVALLSPSAAQQNILHRLVYHASTVSTMDSSGGLASSTGILKFEVLLAQSKTTSSPITPVSDSTAQDILNTAADQAVPESVDVAGTPFPDAATSEASPLSSDATPGPRCWTGLQAAVGLMMPDRPMDMRLLVEDLKVVSSDSEPAELQQYLVALRAFLEQDGSEIEQPDPPSTLTFHGIMYELNATSSVRQSTDVFNPSGAYESSDSTVVVHENILDLESNQKSAVCQVACTDLSDDGWTKFMADCDKLTGFSRRSLETAKPLGLDGIDL